MADLRIGQRDTGDPAGYDGLASVKTMIEMDVEASDVGWGEEPARLFSIDTAMLVLRRHSAILQESELRGLSQRLHEARQLVVSQRDDELDFIQMELEPFMACAGTAEERSVWLAAMNALLPSPFRAAQAAVATALDLDGDAAGLLELLRQRLRARLSEGTLLMTEQPSTLSASA